MFVGGGRYFYFCLLGWGGGVFFVVVFFFEFIFLFVCLVGWFFMYHANMKVAMSKKKIQNPMTRDM